MNGQDQIARVLPQVESDGFQAPLANEATTGGNVSDATMQLGTVESRLYHDANASAVTAARNAVDAKTQNQLYNPQSGLLYQNHGVDAPKATTEVAQQYREHVSETRNLLTNDDQKSMFDRAMSEHGLQVQKTLGDYEHRQVTEGQNAESAAFIQNRQNDIAQGYADTFFVHANIAMQRDEIIKAYARNNAQDPDALTAQVAKGTEPDTLKEAIAKADSASHMLVLNTAMANDQNGYAKAYFVANKDQFTAGDLAKASNMVKVATENDEARAIEEDIQASTKDRTNLLGEEDPNAPPDNLESQLAELKKRNIADTGLRDKIEARLIHQNTLAKGAHQEQQVALIQEAADHLDDPSNTDFSVPANVLGQMDLKSRRVIESRQKQLRTLGRVETDPETRQMMDDMYANPETREAFADVKPEEYADKFNKVEYKNLQQRVANAKAWVATRDRKLEAETIPIDVRNRIFDANGMGLGGLKPGSADRQAMVQRQNTFLDQLNAWGQAEMGAKKRELLPGEWNDGAEKLFSSQSWVEDRPWYDPRRIISNVNQFAPFASREKSVTGPAYANPTRYTVTVPGEKDPIETHPVYNSKEIPPKILEQLQLIATKNNKKLSDADLVRKYNDSLVARP